MDEGPEEDWLSAFLSEAGMWCSTETAEALERNNGWKVTHWCEVSRP